MYYVCILHYSPNPGEKSHAATTSYAHLLDKYTISRFVVAYLGMLTCEHEAIDISKLINSGLLGLSQSVINLSETTLSIENEPIGPNKAPNLQQDTYQGQEEQDEVTCRFLVGTVVVRGPDWKWGDQDGPPPSRGTVISELNSDYWIRVRWDSGSVNSYRMVEDGKYDLALASEIKESSEGESKDHPMDAELTLGMSVPYPAELMATSLILQSSVCLLRSMAVAFSIHSHELPCQTSSLLSNLLLHIMQCGKKESEGSLVLLSKLLSVCLLSHHIYISFMCVPTLPLLSFPLFLPHTPYSLFSFLNALLPLFSSSCHFSFSLSSHFPFSSSFLCPLPPHRLPLR